VTGQGYENAANMTGKCSGVQSNILQEKELPDFCHV
jgi:hypothetical protein